MSAQFKALRKWWKPFHWLQWPLGQAPSTEVGSYLLKRRNSLSTCFSPSHLLSANLWQTNAFLCNGTLTEASRSYIYRDWGHNPDVKPITNWKETWLWNHTSENWMRKQIFLCKKWNNSGFVYLWVKKEIFNEAHWTFIIYIKKNHSCKSNTITAIFLKHYNYILQG